MARRLLMVAALLVSVWALAASWHLPILEMHSFRQTQTAISSYWMATSPHWLAYPTPVLGAPWSLPFEFPVFQGIVAAVVTLLPVNLDQAGRLVSWLFAIATLWPIRRVLLELTGRESLADTVCILFLVSPLYLFWSRAFLIESTALFLAASFLALLATHVRQPRAWLAALLVGCAVLAALVKITTFVGFALAGGMLVLWHWNQNRVPWRISRLAVLYGTPLLAVVAAILATRWWVGFSDLEKARTVWGGALGSGNLAAWNFGSWSQKTGSALWADVVFGRSARDLLGFAWLFPSVAVVALIAPRGIRFFALSVLLLYLAPFLIFTNLHIVHNYYQYANGIFLVVLFACALEGLGAIGGERLKVLGIVVSVMLMLVGFRRDFQPAIVGPLPDTATLPLAAHVRSSTGSDDVLLAFGVDWSSELPYYATRRAMLVPDWVGVDTLRKMRADPSSYLGQYQLGIIVVCPNKLGIQESTAAEYKLLLPTLIEGRTRQLVKSCLVYR